MTEPLRIVRGTPHASISLDLNSTVAPDRIVISLSPNGAHWRRGWGNVERAITRGGYLYRFHHAEIDLVGLVVLSATIPGVMRVEHAIEIVRGHGEPAIYFTTEDHPRADGLDELAMHMGFHRRPGETDQQFRQRIAANMVPSFLGTRTGVEFAIRSASWPSGVPIGAVPLVVEGRDGGILFCRVACDVPVTARAAVRQAIEFAIDDVRAAGTILQLEIVEPNGMPW